MFAYALDKAGHITFITTEHPQALPRQLCCSTHEKLSSKILNRIGLHHLMPKACKWPPIKQQLILCQREPRRKSHTIHFEDQSHLIRFQQQPSSNPYSSLQHSRDMYCTCGPRSRRKATATFSGLTGIVVRPHSPRSAQLSRIAFPRGHCGRLADAGGVMAAVLAMVARGCGGVWRRLRQRCAGRPGSSPFPRGERAVACNARGGMMSAGKSGYGAGMLREAGR